MIKSMELSLTVGKSDIDRLLTSVAPSFEWSISPAEVVVVPDDPVARMAGNRKVISRTVVVHWNDNVWVMTEAGKWLPAEDFEHPVHRVQWY